MELMIAYGIAIILGNLLVSIGFFARKKQFIPRFSDFSKDKIRDILSLGGQFFIIQIAVLLIFTTDNFLILQMLGAEQVTVYNIVFKLFSLFTIGFGIIITPLWSAFTEAKEKRDFIWMKNAITRLNRSLILVVVGLIILSLIYQLILDIWLTKEQSVRPPFNLILSFCLFIIISVWNNIYAFFLNGIGIVKIQVKTAIAGAILNIPLAIFFVKFLNLGLSGVVLAMSGSLFIFSIFGPIFTYRYLNKNVQS
jgi:O-antigen/teichoic acid export membrane protein